MRFECTVMATAPSLHYHISPEKDNNYLAVGGFCGRPNETDGRFKRAHSLIVGLGGLLRV